MKVFRRYDASPADYITVRNWIIGTKVDPSLSLFTGILLYASSHNLITNNVIYNIRYEEGVGWGEGIILLGSGKLCTIQIMRHRTKPIYGVQFHPEYSSGRYQDGVVIFQNFLEIAGLEVKSK